jgi:hypothetical protein
MKQTQRTHMTDQENLELFNANPIDQSGKTFKPTGLWYAMGSSWVDWCSSEMPEWVQPYIYTFDILVETNMLYLNTRKAVRNFSTKYGWTLHRHIRQIDWCQVNRDYAGVEFNPYFYDQRFSANSLWYNGIDVPSGVIFNTDIIRNFKRIK